MDRNKIGKYLQYAIGEIILVVIGILIALQINNWNEKQKELALENTYYCRILDDFKLDKQLIEQSYVQVNQKIKLGKQLILDMHRGNKTKHALLNDWIKVLRLEVYVPRKIAFEDLTSSGNLKLLEYLPLKNSLAQYYANLENILKQMNQNRDELVRRSYPDYPADFGLQEVDYLKTSLGDEIIELLPNEDWIHHKDHESFRKFQNDLIFTLAMYERHKHHLDRISEEMELPYRLLEVKCNK